MHLALVLPMRFSRGILCVLLSIISINCMYVSSFWPFDSLFEKPQGKTRRPRRQQSAARWPPSSTLGGQLGVLFPYVQLWNKLMEYVLFKNSKVRIEALLNQSLCLRCRFRSIRLLLFFWFDILLISLVINLLIYFCFLFLLSIW